MKFKLTKVVIILSVVTFLCLIGYRHTETIRVKNYSRSKKL